MLSGGLVINHVPLSDKDTPAYAPTPKCRSTHADPPVLTLAPTPTPLLALAEALASTDNNNLPISIPFCPKSGIDRQNDNDGPSVTSAPADATDTDNAADNFIDSFH